MIAPISEGMPEDAWDSWDASNAEYDKHCTESCTLSGDQVQSGCSFRLTEFNIYPTFSYLGDQSATYNEFEFTSHSTFGNIALENHTVLNVADLPSTIALGPTNPGDPPQQIGVRAQGFGDILSGFFFPPRCATGV